MWDVDRERVKGGGEMKSSFLAGDFFELNDEQAHAGRGAPFAIGKQQPVGVVAAPTALRFPPEKLRDRTFLTPDGLFLSLWCLIRRPVDCTSIESWRLVA